MKLNNVNMKRKYEKPSVEVVLLQYRQQLLQSSMTLNEEQTTEQW